MGRVWSVGIALLVIGCGDNRPFGVDADLVSDSARVDAPADVSVEDTMTVAGVVTDRLGEPKAGATVFIRGLPPVVSDATGRFSIVGVEAPYDVLVTIEMERLAILYVGMTRPDPILNSASYPTFDRMSTIEGTLTAGPGSTFANPAPSASITKLVLDIAFPGDGHRNYDGGNVVSPFSMPVTWRNTASQDAVLHALQYTSYAGVAMEFHGYGNAGVTVTDGLVETTDIVMQPVETAFVEGTIAVRPNWIGWSVISLLTFQGGNGFALSDSSETPFRHRIPQIPGTRLCMTLSAVDGDGVYTHALRGQLGAPLADLTFQLPTQYPTLVSPSEFGTFSASTQLVHADVPGALFVHGLHPRNDESAPSIYIITMSPSAVVPDLSTFGFSLPSGQAYSWGLRAHLSYLPSMNEAHRAFAFLCDVDKAELVLMPRRTLFVD